MDVKVCHVMQVFGRSNVEVVNVSKKDAHFGRNKWAFVGSLIS